MFKGNFMKILGYVLFAVAAFILVGMFYNTSHMGRAGNYYRDEVFPLYKDFDTNDEYLDEYVTLSNGFYDKDEIYSFSNINETLTGENQLQFTLKIYRARFQAKSNTLYFFPQANETSGFLIVFKDLVFNGESIMDLNREFDPQAQPNHLFRIYLGFDQELANIKPTDGTYAYFLSPLYPAVIEDSVLAGKDGSFATLNEIIVAHVPKNEKGEPNEEKKEFLYVFNSNEEEIYGDIHYEHDLDLVRDNYLFTKDEVKGTFPTEAEVTAGNLSYKALNLSAYNGSVITTTLIVVGVVILAAYFFFFHKLVVAHFQQKRTEKRLAAKKAQGLEDSSEMDADFEEIPDASDKIESPDKVIEEADFEDIDDVEVDETPTDKTE